MKKIDLLIGLLITIPINACRNTISNNTNITFKVAEIKQDNADLKQQHILPEEYEKEEQKACTLRPGEEADFGGHYLPKYIIYKESEDKQWRPLLYVKQTKCAPDGADPSRFPENKYLLMTDLLNRQLPDDYQEVYTFVVKAPLSELTAQSTNEKALSKIKNPYQELNVILDDMTQKILELFSNILKEIPTEKSDHQKPGNHKVPSDNTEDSSDEATCDMCSHFN